MCAPPRMQQNFLKFMQFLRKSGKFICWCRPQGLVPPSIGNPRSAPDNIWGGGHLRINYRRCPKPRKLVLELSCSGATEKLDRNSGARVPGAPTALDPLKGRGDPP